MFAELMSPTLELIHAEGAQVVLKSRRSLETGQDLAVKIALPEGGRQKSRLRVHGCRQLMNGGFAISGILLGRERLPDTTPAEDDAALRSNTRIECHIVVLSKDLPGYKAVSVDFSAGGLQIEVTQEVAAGQTVLLKIDFELAGVKPFECRARVAWCNGSSMRYRVGLQFVDLTFEQRDALDRYERILQGRSQSHIMHRLLFGNNYASFEGPAVPVRGPEEETPTFNPMATESVAGQHTGRIKGYHRADDELVVFVARCNKIVQYRFQAPRGLTDFFGAEAEDHTICDIQVKPSAAGARRFQFVDDCRRILLEVVAVRCIFS